MFTDKYGILVEDAKGRFIRGKSYEKIISLFLNMAEDHGMIKKVDLSDMY